MYRQKKKKCYLKQAFGFPKCDNKLLICNMGLQGNSHYTYMVDEQ